MPTLTTALPLTVLKAGSARTGAGLRCSRISARNNVPVVSSASVGTL